MRYGLFACFALLLGCGGCDSGLGEPFNENCGNGTVEGREVCDGAAIGGESCASQGFDSGTLACAAGCGGFIFAGCEGIKDAPSPCSLCAGWEECHAGECVSICAGEPFIADTELALGYTTVNVSGVVSAGSSPAVSGELIFSGEVFWDPLRVEIGSDGAFEARIQPGSYEVTFAPSDDSLSKERLPDLEIESDTTLQLELTPWQELRTPVRFSGELPGASPYPGDRGHLIIESLDRRFGLTNAKFDDEGDSTAPLHVRDGEVHLWWAHEIDDVQVAEFLETTTIADLRGRDFIDIPLRFAAIQLTWNGGAVRSDGEVQVEVVRADEIPRPAWNGQNRDRESWRLEQGRASGWLLDRRRDVAVVASGPPWWGWVWAQRDITVDDEMSIDVTAPPMAGEIRRNDRRLPNSAQDGATRGRLEFSSFDGMVTVELSERGPGEFDVELPRGLWSLSISGNPWSGVLPVVPYRYPQSITVSEGRDDLELNVPSVRLAGQLTINGERPPDEPELDTRGWLEIRKEPSRNWFTIPIPPAGPAVWDVIVSPGDYEVELTRWWFTTSGEEPPSAALPLGRWAVGDFEVTASTRRDVDVRVADVEVSVMRDGEPAPPGLLWFEDLRTDRVSREFTTGAAPSSTTLYPGYYRVLWAELDDSGEAAHTVVLEHRLAVSESMSREFDASQVRLSGDLSVNGEAVTDAGDVLMTFARQPNANASKTAQVAAAGRATFEIETMRGLYDILLSPAEDHPLLVNHGVILHRACADESLD